MSVFASPMTGGVMTQEGLTAVSVVVLLTLFVLVVEKAVEANVSTGGAHGFARYLLAGIVPLGLASLALVSIALARIVRGF